ncbi:MAG: hypothetical protein IPF52_16485 [Saprospiraceae bacterium]|nr:hypothetical protein [Saprospiraceae bacterium]
MALIFSLILDLVCHPGTVYLKICQVRPHACTSSFFLLIRSGIIFSQEVLSLNDAVSFGLKNRFDIPLTRNQQKILDVNNNNYGNADFIRSFLLREVKTTPSLSTRQEFFSGDIREGTGVNSTALSASVALDYCIFDGKKYVYSERQA